MSKADRPDQPGAAERFNEDQATYAVRGEGKPDLDAGVGVAVPVEQQRDAGQAKDDVRQPPR